MLKLHQFVISSFSVIVRRHTWRHGRQKYFVSPLCWRSGQ